MRQYDVTAEFDRSPVALDFGNVERETTGGHYRVDALMTERTGGGWVADLMQVQVKVGREWLRTDLPLDEKAKIAEYLEAEAEREEAENEMFEELCES